MAEGETRKTAQAERWKRSIVRHLEDFGRQYAALENAMAAFGDNFALEQFKAAFTTRDDMDAYNRVQALERALGRVQNFVGELAEKGVRLAHLPRAPVEDDGSPATQAFESLRDAGIIDSRLCRRLARAQRARSRIEHGYVRIPAGDVHRATQLVHEAARDFIGPFRAWIAPYLD